MRRSAPSTPPSSALAKAFSDRGIADGVQVNSVLPGPVMTGRRRSYLQHWAPLHGMTAEEAMAAFPQEAGIARYGEPEEIAELMAFLVSPGARWMTGSALRMDGGVSPVDLKTASEYYWRDRLTAVSPLPVLTD